MYLLGIDLGRINCKMVLMNLSRKIIDIYHVPIIKSDKNTSHEIICTKLAESLEKVDALKIPESIKADEAVRPEIIIVVEKQPGINVKTNVLFGNVYMYFILKKLHDNNNPDNFKIKSVTEYHAGKKLTVYHPLQGDPEVTTNKKDGHSKNKDIGIQHAIILMKRYKEDKFLEMLMKEKKKDDIADAYLMLLAYIKFKLNIADPDATEDRKSEMRMGRANYKVTYNSKVPIGSERIDKPGFIMGHKGRYVKKDSKIGLQILEGLEGLDA